ncbi:SsrA-binding protein SmpB [Patescibacteria group bacterium]|nr:MAG: SsrA-binding protein SmpB [Patescibacteria group bacterium]
MKILALNRRAKHDYELLERLEAGLVLAGQEVKSVKLGHVSLKGSFIHLRNGEAYLENCHIRRYSQASQIHAYEPTQSRKLLLKRKELDHLQTSKRAEGLAIIPTAIGVTRGLIKLEIAIGRGRKRYDKRQVARAKAIQKDASLEVKARLNN